jgi:kynurenine formamidase
MPLTPDLEELAAKVSNWGRWGADDQRGTLNLIDEAAVLRGAQAVRSGRSFSLAIPFDQDGPQWDTVHMPDRVNPELRTHMVNTAFTGDPRDFTTSDDNFRMGSQAATHWDALAHVGYDGKLYNNTPMSVVTAESGAAKLGIDRYGVFATRGVLLDVPRALGVEGFDDAYPITGDDLDAAAKLAQVTIEAGDAILVRTGQERFRRPESKERYSKPSPGLSTKSIAWFHDHDIAATATDNLTFECYPCENPAIFMPVAMIQSRDMGMALGQNWHLSELADDCARDGQYDVLLTATPLPLTGGVGAPVAPTAIK